MSQKKEFGMIGVFGMPKKEEVIQEACDSLRRQIQYLDFGNSVRITVNCCDKDEGGFFYTIEQSEGE